MEANSGRERWPRGMVRGKTDKINYMIMEIGRNKIDQVQAN